MKPTKLVSHDEIEFAKKAFNKVLENGNTIQDPFTAAIEKKMILFYHNIEFDEKYYRAIWFAAQKLGENGDAFISQINLYKAEADYKLYQTFWKKLPNSQKEQIEKVKSMSFEEHEHWRLNVRSYIPFKLETLVTQNALYSASGTWGVIFSHEGYAIVGGSKEFIDLLLSQIPDIEREVYEFFEYERQSLDKYPDSISEVSSWLPLLIEQIYGGLKSKEMLIDSGLSCLLSSS